MSPETIPSRGKSLSIKKAELVLNRHFFRGRNETRRAPLDCKLPAALRTAVNGADQAKEAAVFGAVIQTITQNPFGSFDPRFDVASIIEPPLRVSMTLDRAARCHRIASLLLMVGLEQ